MRVRALFGLFEGDPGDVVFAGAVSEITWELTPDEEEWNRILARLKETCPHGTTDWREAWIDIDLPDGLFAVPELKAAVSPPSKD